MAVDQKISELAPAASISGPDLSVLVHSGVDYKFTFDQLITFLGTNLAVGSVITFSNDTPSGATGKDGDVVIKPASGEFWQKVAGTWILSYTVPEPDGGNTVLYGTGAPNSATGINGDTYIDTTAGVGKFYKKTAGAWTQVFSMATGPAGAPGAPGTNGTNGIDGKTVLNGITTPSNDLGANGDFYINTNTWFVYGPKAAGVWGLGTSMTAGSSLKKAYNYINTDARFVYDSVNYTLTFNLNSTDKILFPYLPDSFILIATLRQKYSATKYKQKNSFEPEIVDDGANYISVKFDGIEPDLVNDIQIVLS